MTELVVTALALGVAGIDPAGLLLAVGALAAGARERTVLAFALVTVLGTALLGTVLSLVLGPQLQGFTWSSLLPPDWLGALLEAGVAVALLVWAGIRVTRPEARPPRPDEPRTGSTLLLAGVLLAASAPLDPTFTGLVVLAGRGEPAVAVGAAHLLWICVSQLPLLALAVAILLRRHGRAVAWLKGLIPRVRPVLARVATVALALAGAVMTLDVAWWVVTDRFLFFDS